jgi:hypothetical protein
MSSGKIYTKSIQVYLLSLKCIEYTVNINKKSNKSGAGSLDPHIAYNSEFFDVRRILCIVKENIFNVQIVVILLCTLSRINIQTTCIMLSTKCMILNHNDQSFQY